MLQVLRWNQRITENHITRALFLSAVKPTFSGAPVFVAQRSQHWCDHMEHVAPSMAMEPLAQKRTLRNCVRHRPYRQHWRCEPGTAGGQRSKLEHKAMGDVKPPESEHLHC